MRTRTKIAIAATGAIVLGSSAWAAGRTLPGGGWGPRGSYGRLWDAHALATTEGTIEKIARFTPEHGMSEGVHLLVKVPNEKDPLDVHLGPAWFIDQQEITFAAGDAVSITGSKVTIAGKPAMIAQKVTRGADTLVLRDENGLPVWAAWRQPAGT